MTSHLPSFRSLAALEAVVRHGNIVKAAEELGVTPGAVSKQLSNLEVALGAELFEEGHRLQPTSVAAELARSVGRAARMLRDAWSEATHQTDTRVLILTGNASLCMHWLMPRILAVQNAVNGRPIRMTALHTTDNWWQSPIDIAFMRHDHVPPGWGSQDIGVERLTLVGTVDRARRAAARGVEALSGEMFVTADTRPGDLEKWLAAAGVRADVTRRSCMHFYIAMAAALGGDGFVVAPTALCHDLIVQKRLAAPFPHIHTRGAKLTGTFNRSSCSQRTADGLFSWVKAELRKSTPLPAVA